MSSSLELEKTEENVPKLDLGEPKPKRKYVKKPKPVELDLTPAPSQEPVQPAEPKEPVEPKVKKPRSEAQKLAFEKCLEKKRILAEERKLQRNEVMEEKLMLAEDKIVKTGIKLQKKALIKLAIEEGDDIDIPDSVVKAVLKKRASKTQPKPPPVQSHTPPQSPSRKFSFVDN